MNYRISVFVLTAISGLPSFCVLAQDAPPPPENAVEDIGGRFYASPMYSYTFADRRREAGDANGGMIAVGKQMNPHANLELYGSYSEFGSKDEDGHAGRTKTAGLAVAAFPFATSDASVGRLLGGAYAVCGVGYAKGSNLPLRDERYDQNHEGYIIDLGVGYLARLPYVRFASLRIDARYRMNFVKSPFASVEIKDDKNDRAYLDDVVLSIGLLVPVGPRPQLKRLPASTAEVVPPVQDLLADGDGDGVADDLDQCPGTPIGAAVDDRGCGAGDVDPR